MNEDHAGATPEEWLREQHYEGLRTMLIEYGLGGDPESVTNAAKVLVDLLPEIATIGELSRHLAAIVVALQGIGGELEGDKRARTLATEAARQEAEACRQQAGECRRHEVLDKLTPEAAHMVNTIEVTKLEALVTLDPRELQALVDLHHECGDSTPSQLLTDVQQRPF